MGDRNPLTEHEPDLPSDTGSEPLLDAVDVKVYQYFLETSPDPGLCSDVLELSSEDVGLRINKLASHRLLKPSLSSPGCYDAAPPDLAVAELTAPLQVEAHRLMRHSEQTRREINALVPIYRAHQRKMFSTTTTELLNESSNVRQRLSDLAAQVQMVVLAAHPTMGPPAALRAALDLDKDLLNRGVEYRSVVPHTARRQRDSMQHLHMLQDLGAQVRTAAVVPGRMILLDGMTALVSIGKGSGAALFRDPAMVDFLTRIFEHIWEHAKPLTASSQDTAILEDIELSILGELARGRSDEFISRRLSISTRTLRRYLSSMCEKLAVETRFQLGMAAGNIDLDGADGSPETS